MADAAAARREARRRRILENSHNRLQLISGKSVDSIRQDAPSSYLIPDQNEVLLSSAPDIHGLPQLGNGALAPEPESLEFLSTNQEMTAGGDGETTNEFSPLFTPAPAAIKTGSLLGTLLDCKYDIVLLSLVIQFLHSCSLFASEEAYFFLPLIMYDVTKFMWFPPEYSPKFANILLMLNGMSAARIQRILGVWRWLQVLIQDGCVYLFATICIQSLLISI